MNESTFPEQRLSYSISARSTAQLIARRVRDLGVFSAIVPRGRNGRRAPAMNPSAIILSGGPGEGLCRRRPERSTWRA